MSLSINCRGKLLNLTNPVVMGIINLTPDSFYKESLITGEEVVEIAEKMLYEGAEILDIGAISTRPGAQPISEKEELDRILKPMRSLRKNFPDCLLSVDTYRGAVARACLEEGVQIINDISGTHIDPSLLDVLTHYRPAYILMHMKGLPETMHLDPQYEDVVLEVMNFFAVQKRKLVQEGVTEIILDPGFGFGKKIDHNFELLRGLQSFQIFDCPVLAGLSRKSLIWKTLKITAEEALNGTTALHMLALQKGANILRVHDVKPAIEAIQLWKRYERNK